MENFGPSFFTQYLVVFGFDKFIYWLGVAMVAVYVLNAIKKGGS